VKPASTTFDKLAIGLSTVCAVHCLLLPILLVALPAVAATSLGDESFHQWMLVAVLPTSLIALFTGCRRHRNNRVLSMGILGLAVLTITAFLGHELFGETGEVIASLFGASLIAFSHYRNHRLRRQALCCALD
jgi:uncharacterized membrane protein YfcA